jgi:uncharacterized protein involved in tolerance to divalent cations
MVSQDITTVNAHGEIVIKQDQGFNLQGEDHFVPGTDYHGEAVAPKITPGHLDPINFEASKAGQKSGTGLSIVTLTVDTLENTELFLRRVFHEGLCSRAQIIDGGFERSYLKLGSAHDEDHRVYLEMTTTHEKVAELVDYANKHPPVNYDYPVPDLTVLAIKDGSRAYVEWALSAVENGKKIKLDEQTDHTEIVDK